MPKSKLETERCMFDGCNKKLKMTNLQCLCKNRFCDIHRLPEEHACSFDFKKRDRDNLKKAQNEMNHKINTYSMTERGNAY